ncbi:MAG: HAD family hydrolase [Chloroflexi bacterium]|jgi:HAD superfamily hydrolase (TIGR01509 family)|nr:HAD family hydrolase [Chloroflexota bacterium]MBT3669174.1 HAD family hydrolase [Chloroflexota bacterium]MBT4003447.1 HAD family hydrolase [Chloroflexota bacterium]MBT4306419.1 HAD family hydrolase [Chloroflexota bacterium]MBT4534918.1 HAD family hydrolase [Chloroflexota bacterium]
MKALIFDFDGLIIDTEMPDFISWQEVYTQHKAELPQEKWLSTVGGSAESDFDPLSYLKEITGKEINEEEIWIARRRSYMEHLESQPVLPGVVDYLNAAKDLGLKLAIASSSPNSWVAGHLTRLNLIQYFDVLCTADDVEKTKPDPALFLLAAERLGVDTSEAIIFEDSSNGVKAANRAGIFVVVVPNVLTASLDLSTADIQLTSLTEIALDELLLKASD